MTGDQESIKEAIGVLLNHAPVGSKVILYGSYARDEPKPSSDVGFLVIEPHVDDRIREAARLRIAVHCVLKKFLVPVDILVLSAEEFERWRKAPNTVYRHAAEEGQVQELVPASTSRRPPHTHPPQRRKPGTSAGTCCMYSAWPGRRSTRRRSIQGTLTNRNRRAIATGPTAVQRADAGCAATPNR